MEDGARIGHGQELRLRVAVEGSFDEKIAALETLVELAADAGAETAADTMTSPGGTTT